MNNLVGVEAERENLEQRLLMPQTKCNDVFNALALKSFYLRKFVDKVCEEEGKKVLFNGKFRLRNKSDYEKIFMFERQKEFSISSVINIEAQTFLKSSLTFRA